MRKRAIVRDKRVNPGPFNTFNINNISIAKRERGGREREKEREREASMSSN